ncbi:putative periplasmic protein kinase ArgK and related GTPases of G3E family [Paramagnetospirillum magnetotacticum MS-1]|uniref:Putative periplasmic protein kinase ArgK and related GTPases of G3E family n=1 Tax=Paramagnetospirillum magnetotacticum MS-1 TaxID=272627 RepID=A0A0C2UG80_PARME|nr:methylmalonyl Co-A mutase-associated GTPase MeaB [Paramagnetospirillum magnetotacticum]KIM00533.1 putative periplasmic protein kinase ArgK and related GTPases of G3E family [Paramagnetospirillum magnetotacticum MS-1]
MTKRDKNEIAATRAALALGDIRVCARLISRVEREEEGLVHLLQALYKAGGRAQVIGVTGPPGAGKSSLVSQMIRVWRKRGKKVAVLAVDPSSPFSGGAVLGDRLRMADHTCDDGVFIRSMASRGQLGGLAKAAGDALTVLDAMNWDVIIIETVGVGQNETAIIRHADLVVLVQTPMGGGDVQAAKAGINEIGDIYVVNKGDHPEADRTVSQIRDMVTLGHHLHPETAWIPPVLKTQSLLGQGAEELADTVQSWFDHVRDHPDSARMRARQRVRHRTAEIIRDRLDKRLLKGREQIVESLIDQVVSRDRDPYALADSLLAALGNGPEPQDCLIPVMAD